MFSSACTLPVAKQFYAACIEAGHGEAECRMRATEVNQRGWAQVGQGLSAMGNSMPRSSVEIAPITCTTINTGGPVVQTTCQ